MEKIKIFFNLLFNRSRRDAVKSFTIITNTHHISKYWRYRWVEASGFDVEKAVESWNSCNTIFFDEEEYTK